MNLDNVEYFTQKEGYIWHNDKLVPWQDATVHVCTHALHYASSVFEGERAYNGKIFKLEEHSDRLIKSANILGFTIPWSSKEISAATNQVLAKNNLKDCYIRPVAWRGADGLKLYEPKYSTVHLAIIAWEWEKLHDNRNIGIRICTSNYRRPSPETSPCHAKAAGVYMISTLSKQISYDKGYDDALLLDYRGFLAESTGANLFFVIDGKLHTPIPDCFLDGITRRTIIDVAKQNNIEVVERHIYPHEMHNASEVFICGTAAEVTSVVQIDDINFQLGNITSLLAQEYKKAVNGSN